MKKRILITGGSGFIGSRLVSDWLQQGHEVVVFSRRPQRLAGRHPALTAVDDLDQLQGSFDWLINLAGESIADQRWSRTRKQQLRDSRIAVTEKLVSWAVATGQRFERVLSGSAIGYYGGFADDSQQPLLDESAAPGNDFAAILCRDWEAAAQPLKPLADQLVWLRTGVVLGPRGGMLGKLWLPFRSGLGGKLGCGKQVLSWIHLDDYVAAVHWLLQSDVQGPVNMASPAAVTNAEFTRMLSATLERPAWLPVPALPLRLALGEMASLLLEGQRVSPMVLQQMGFEWSYAELDVALADLRQRWSQKLAVV
ncbi:TIGR01777 family oxidoreductase [Oceanobacter mangrovi]|uniref:TIGR01777 family oxidoreductase n=1 Tax=Oceanobacter mangrovi TaxID=2862510 RepID=UPI001C8D57AE|nr:TIGR01777 family oxidoreductase [Oceanobacter mangrovi]